MGRGRTLAFAALLAISFAVAAFGRAVAEVAMVPPSLQVELLDRVSYFEHGYRRRAASRATILVVHRRGSASSERVATQLVSALRDARSIGGVPAAPQLVAFASSAELRSLVDATGAAIVWFAPGLESDAPAIANGLTRSGALTVASTPLGVREGAVLGFGLESSRPVIFINERLANEQDIHFSFEVLRRARLVR